MQMAISALPQPFWKSEQCASRVVATRGPFWKSEQCAFRVVATRANSTGTFEKVIINETADLELQRRSSQDRPSCESRPATLICQVEVPVPNLDVRDSLWLSTVVNDDVSIIINSG